MRTHPGSCHCGAITIKLTLDKSPEEMRAGRCGCSFCRRHGARTLGDPAGRVEFRARSEALQRYRFGLGITDYLLCAHCGTYVGAVMPDEGLGIVNVNALECRAVIDPAPPLHDYDGEDAARRRARRRKFWMPASILS
ncbi:MAG: hypothetical protein FJX02_10690 [Alphaproteobacteria bacterium]|nr:hypothetical protein [Alphaproteobacteria bacterium]